MIKISGVLNNTVDAGCYEIEAIPVPVPRKGQGGCGCEDIETAGTPDESYPRVAVDEKRGFTLQVDDDQVKKWFQGTPPRFAFRVYLDGQVRPTAKSIVWTLERQREVFPVDLCAVDGLPPCGKVCGKVTDCRG